MKPPPLLKQSQFGPPTGVSVQPGDESICGSQEAVVHPQAADRPAGPAALPATALHSTAKGESCPQKSGFSEGSGLFNPVGTGGWIVSATSLGAFACVTACLRHFMSSC